MKPGLRDYEAWHRAYDDPDSSLSWRLRRVRATIDEMLDARAGGVRVISACADDGRDLIGVLAQRGDAARVSALLLEKDPGIAGRARRTAASAGLTAQVEVRTLDAGCSDAYLGAPPADLLLLVGIFGNISDADLRRTIAASPQLCSPGAIVVWSRGRGGDLVDRNDEIRTRFAARGFTELDYCTLERGSRPAVGVARYDGPPRPLIAGRRWFTFQR